MVAMEVVDLKMSRVCSLRPSGADPELEFRGLPYLSFSCEKFLKAFVCYRKHFRLMGWPCPRPPRSAPDVRVVAGIPP